MGCLRLVGSIKLWSLLQNIVFFIGHLCKKDLYCKEPTNRSHPIPTHTQTKTQTLSLPLSLSLSLPLSLAHTHADLPEIVVEEYDSLCILRAQPKSQILTRPSPISSRFRVLRSRCMNLHPPFWCHWTLLRQVTSRGA